MGCLDRATCTANKCTTRYSHLYNSRGGGAQVLELINEEKGINEKRNQQGGGELCKRLINEEEGICVMRGEKYEKTISETCCLLERWLKTVLL